jgi:CheY-like chemotaxis protein
METEKAHHILVIEDNATDVSLISEALKKHSVAFDMTVLADGRKAIEYLADVERGPKPELIILDLNLPRNDRIEILAKYRTSFALDSVPIIVLTSSDAPDDRQRATALGISAFIQKPMNLWDYLALGKRFRQVLEAPYDHIEQQER